MQRKQWFLLCLLLWLMPWVISFEAIDAGFLPRHLLLGLGLLLLLIPFIIETFRKTNLPSPIVFTRASLLWFAWLVIGLLSIPTSINPSEAVFEWLRLSQFGILLWITPLLISSPQRLQFLSSGVSLVALALCTVGFLQFFVPTFPKLPGEGLIYGTLNNRNLYAISLLLTCPFLFITANQFSIQHRILAYLGLLAVGCLIGLTHSRSVWLALGVGTALVVIGLLVGRRQNLFQKDGFSCMVKHITLAFFCLISGFIFGFILLKTAHDPLPATRQLATKSQRSIDSRWFLNQQSLALTLHHPLLGVGLGNWKLHYPELSSHDQEEVIQEKIQFIHPHNDYLSVSSETGLPGLILYLLCFLSGFWALRQTFIAKPDNWLLFTSLFLAFGISAFMVDSLFSFPKDRPFPMSLAMVLLACLHQLEHQTHPPSHPPASPIVTKIFLTTLAVILLASITVGGIRYRAELLVNRGLALWKRDKIQQLAVFHLGQAHTWWSQMDPSCFPLPYFQASVLAESGKFEEAIPYFEEALKIHPNNPTVITDYGRVEGHLKNYPKAIELFERSLVLRPRSQPLLFNLSVLHFNAGNLNRARELIVQCPPDNSNPSLESYREKILSAPATSESKIP